MNNEKFKAITEDIFRNCSELLFEKSMEYANDEDKLSNFKRISDLCICTPEKALGGMLAKHIISIYDMIEYSGKSVSRYREEQWDEKIYDSINYLVLLKALTVEDEEGIG